MDKEKLKKTVVFRGMEDDELDAALAALGAAGRTTATPLQQRGAHGSAQHTYGKIPYCPTK